jgi:hypothetical protein
VKAMKGIQDQSFTNTSPIKAVNKYQFKGDRLSLFEKEDELVT